MKTRPQPDCHGHHELLDGAAMEDLKRVLGMVDILLVNDSEARQLSGEFAF